MTPEASAKVTSQHLKRQPFLYVRQSTLRQVVENTESKERQYALRQRAVALGWPAERIVVIDRDLGKSGAGAADREGFKQLVAEVSLGHAGIVLGLEVSRLARNCTDWHQLLEICALTDTLILDQDGIYCPRDFNDRLLLGLKGTMSEAELHLISSRLHGGLLNQARRGDLKMRLPVGLVYDLKDEVRLDPDQRVQETFRVFFRTFERTASATATVKYFHREQLLFPRRLREGPNQGELVWGPLVHSQALRVLHSPRYAGAFAYGRSRQSKDGQGHTVVHPVPRDQWLVSLPERHAGYISFAQYETNLQRLRDNAQAQGEERLKSPPREGPALLQGLVICGRCGRRMTIRYHCRHGELVPLYVCQSQGVEQAVRICQSIPGGAVDQAVAHLLLEIVTPMSLEVSLSVERELQLRAEEVDQLRQQKLTALRYEAELAQRRFLRVDPDHRLVADELEADWNQCLLHLREAQRECDLQHAADQKHRNSEQRKQILALAQDFPCLWKDPQTPQRERKRMLRLLLEDITLLKDKELMLHIRFKGGATRTLTQAKSLSAPKLRQTSRHIVQEIDRLLQNHSDGQVASELNHRGLTSGTGQAFTRRIVAKIRRTYNLKTPCQRLCEAGLLTLEQMSERLAVATGTVKTWRDAGLLRAYEYNDKHECLYEPPGPNAPCKEQGRKLRLRSRPAVVRADPTNEVQYDA
jgi:DNA invertase Pin-like site-specific DNA recombinase